MGWYTVTKRIKGKRYLYRQRTYREKGKVHTESQYIGPAGDFERAVAAATIVEETIIEPPVEAEQEVEEEPEIEGQPVNTTEKYDALFPYFEGKAKNSVSDTVLRGMVKELERLRDQMEHLGVDGNSLKPVRFKFAKSVGLKRGWGGQYTLTLQKSAARTRKTSAAIRKAYRSALAEMFMDAMERNSPHQFSALRDGYDKAYRDTKMAMVRYIWAGHGGREAMALTLHAMMTGRWQSWEKERLKPESLGMVDEYGGGWQRDATEMISEVMANGLEKTRSKYAGALVRTQRTLLKAIEERSAMGIVDLFTGKRRKQKYRIRKLIAREAAVKGLLNRLDTVRPLMREKYE